MNGLRILVVDDAEDTREWLQAVLSMADAEVRVAAHAQQALVLVTAWRPHVRVSDIGLPEQDGYSLIAAIRALSAEQGGGTPAVALTAYARDEDRQHALACGYQVHMAKPADLGHLLQTVADLARCHSSA